ncbi:hypothetical protein NQT69_05580 [Pseudoalteromonas shioyasakiensis]|uniref:hypothetical protein n=1 Tax=Pseudoalteromonas shioyasakiensis TaxID=1190813 RepID=UPI002118500C|nr:hypothetical protein [Pseudoalteromonas shioyasakiensis]MCQ8877503.1 hypothetical protein [Pseudoalteromonas shioyasakiensis]
MLNSQQHAEHQMQSLFASMSSYIEQRNWGKLRDADRQLLVLIEEAKQAPWFAAFSPKLVKFKAQYKKNIALISEQQNELEKKMIRHQHDREGIVAYKQLMSGDS